MTLNRAFVMGHPISHSRSPMMHGSWLKQCAIDGTYERVDVAPAALADFFARYKDEGWIGGNVTVPNKLAVMPHLAHIDEDAQAIGAVNTIWWDKGGLVGGNTDATGFMGNLDELAPGWDQNSGRAVIIGAGGATRAVAYGLLKRGFDVAICNRTVGKAEELATHFGKGATAHAMDDLGQLMADAALLVNATSLGMIGQPPLDLELGSLKSDAVVYDIVYVPLETALLKQAKSRGHRTVDGLGMLIHQGAVSFSRWFHQMPEITLELRQMLIDDIKAKTPGA